MLSQRTMRELQVQGLPPDNEPSRVMQVLSKIRVKLTQFRSVLKEKVTNFLAIVGLIS